MVISSNSNFGRTQASNYESGPKSEQKESLAAENSSRSNLSISAMADVQETLSTSCVSFSELKPDDIREGKVSVHIPLKKGEYMFPGIYADAKIKVKKGAHADLVMVVEKNELGESYIKNASISFDPPLKVKNPASAFTKTGKIWGSIKDSVADAVIEGFAISSEGKIHIDGHVSLGFLGKQDLNKKEYTSLIPKIDMRLKAIFEEISKKKQSSWPKINSWSVFDLLKQVGALTEKTLFSLDIKTEPVGVRFGSDKFNSWTEKSDTNIHFAGVANVTPGGEIEVSSDPRHSSIENNNMNISVRSETVVSGFNKSELSYLSHVGGKARFKKFHGSAEFTPQKLEFSSEGEDNQLDVHAFVKNDGKKTTLMPASSAELSTSGMLKDNTHVSFAPSRFTSGKTKAHIKSGVNLSVTDNKLGIHGGFVRAESEFKNLSANAFGYTASFPGNIRASLAALDIRKDANKEPTMHGSAQLEIEPSKGANGAASELKPFVKRIDYDYKSFEKVRVDSVNNGLTDFLRPIADLVWSPDKVVDPKLSPVGDVGSKAWQARVEELTGSTIKKGNQAELLIDGVMSLPKRLEMIRQAKDYICYQTFAFLNDETGLQIAKELVEAKKRGVEVYVVIDSMGSTVMSPGGFLKSVLRDNPIYKMFRENDVKFKVFSDSLEKGAREVAEVVKTSRELQEGLFDSLSSISSLLQATNFVVDVASRRIDVGLDDEKLDVLRTGLARIWGGKSGLSIDDALSELSSLTQNDEVSFAELLKVVKQLAELNHRWHTKRLVVDNRAILGGMNTGDHYLLGGTGRKVLGREIEREAWRDTDILLKGPCVEEVLQHFANDWEVVAGVRPKITYNGVSEVNEEGSGLPVQIIQNRPREDGGHHITNFLIESLKSLKQGEKYYAASAYFLPTGALERFKEALIDAAQRGVDIRIVTNSKDTTELPQVNRVAQCVAYRDLLEGGVRIFERTGNQTMHTKATSIGSKVGVVGSANTNNRSASLDGESVAVVHEAQFSKQVEEMILKDMSGDVAKEIFLKDVEYTSLTDELKNVAWATLKDTM